MARGQEKARAYHMLPSKNFHSGFSMFQHEGTSAAVAPPSS